MLYHGTLLYAFDLSLIERLLRMPPRMPDYRGGREHGEFVRNLDFDTAALSSALAEAFEVTEALTEWPVNATQNLAERRYSQDSWNLAR